MKKGRHRRFEEARKLKQIGPDFLFSEPAPPVVHEEPEDKDPDDEYAEIAARYGAFDDEDDDTDAPDDDDKR